MPGSATLAVMRRRRRAARIAVVLIGALLTAGTATIGGAALASRLLSVDEVDPHPGLPRHLDGIDLPLSRTEFFTTYNIGATGAPSPGGKQFRKLLRSDHREEEFQKLIAEGRAAGKLYGLCGLLVASPRSFEEIAAELSRERERVFLMEGCFASSSTLDVLLHRPGVHVTTSRFFEICESLRPPPV